jgi:hypothetical protein
MLSPTIETWLKYAPQPGPLPPNARYHVFISYRSVNRSWVLQLYDLLRELNYEVFLDQYVLAAAAPLALSLNEALDSSLAAILIWSSSFEDSEWCRKEYNTLETKENSGSGFRYVIAKVDETPLSGLPSGKIHVDFSQNRDGPTGDGLLRVICGLQSKPLTPEAVTLAAQVDDAMRTARAQIRAARGNGDLDRLGELAKSTGLAWQTSSALACEVADALIALGKPLLALPILLDLQSRFPRSLRPRQLEGLALARMKDWQGAQRILGELYAAGEIDPETLGIYARTWMDRYNATRQKLYLLKSRDLYRQAFEAAPRDYYTGINAASKSLLLGEKETAAQLAKRVETLVGRNATPGDYWRSATVAEVQLLQGNLATAATRYLEAVLIAPEDHGSHQSTRAQAILLLAALAASPEDSRLVLAAFDHDGCSDQG